MDISVAGENILKIFIATAWLLY